MVTGTPENLQTDDRSSRVTGTPKISSSTTKWQSQHKSKQWPKTQSDPKPDPQKPVPPPQPEPTPRPPKLWKYRPFTRVIRGYRAFRLIQSYVRLNELEACGIIKYSPHRLRGLSAGEWELLRGVG